MKYFVYWYHLKTHKDVWTEGYIGVTNDLVRRHNEHMRNSNGLVNHFYNAIEYYGKEAIQRTILHECDTADEAYELEEMYRPEKNIGWNFAKGGNDTLQNVQRKPVTLFHQSNPNKEYTFESITEAAQILGITVGRIRQAIFRKHNVYGEDGWSVIHENTDKTTIKSISEIRSINMSKYRTGRPSPLKGKKRWTDEQKAHIGSFHKGRTISKEQIEYTRQFNRLNSPYCKQITLVHQSNPEKEYTYHSISEASRQLGIPLPRLKSKASRPLGRYGKDGWKILKLDSQSENNELT